MKPSDNRDKAAFVPVGVAETNDCFCCHTTAQILAQEKQRVQYEDTRSLKTRDHPGPGLGKDARSKWCIVSGLIQQMSALICTLQKEKKML